LLITALIIGGLTTAASESRAAADNTLGMALLSASVNSDGTLARGVATGANKLGTGLYEVIFDRDLTTCSYTVSPGIAANGGSLLATFSQAEGRAGNADGVFVELQNQAGNTVDAPFHLIVFCPK
jgi:hypothetical protein